MLFIRGRLKLSGSLETIDNTRLVQLSIHKTILRNFSFLTVSTALSQAISLLAILKITSVFSPESYGTYSFLVAQGILIYTIADFGLRHVVIRAVARDHDMSQSFYASGLLIKSTLLLVVVCLYSVYNLFAGHLSAQSLLYVTLFAAANCAANLFENIFFGRQRMRIAAFLSVGYSLLWLAAVFLIPDSWMDADRLFVVFLLLNIIKALSYLLSLHLTNSLTGMTTALVPTAIRMLRESWPYFGIVLIMLPFTSLPANFLQARSTVEQVGFFSLAQRLLGPMSLVMELALSAIFPNLSSMWIQDRVLYKNYVGSSFRYYLLLNISLCFAFSLFAKEIVLLLFPDSYLPAVKVSQIHVWYLYMALIDSMIGTILSSANKERLILKFAIVRTSISAPILYLASIYGAMGFALANLVLICVFVAVLWYIFSTVLHIKVMHAPHFLVATLLLAALCYWIQDSPLTHKLIVGVAYATIAMAYVMKITNALRVRA